MVKYIKVERHCYIFAIHLQKLEVYIFQVQVELSIYQVNLFKDLRQNIKCLSVFAVCEIDCE